MRFKVLECCKQTLSLYLFLIFHRSIPLFLGNIRLVSSLATTYSSISGVPPIPSTKASTQSLRVVTFDIRFKKRPRTKPVTSSPLVCNRPLACYLGRGHAMRVEDELLGGSLVEVHVALRGLLQSNDCGVDRLGDLHLVVQDRIHQLAMVPHDRALTGGEGEGLGPAQTDADAELANLGVLVDPARVAGHIQARNTHSPANLGDAHDIVEHRRRSLSCTSAVAACLKADTVDGRVHHRLTDDLGDHVGQFAALCEVDGFAAEAAGLCQSLTVHIADDDHSPAEQMRPGGARQANRSA